MGVPGLPHPDDDVSVPKPPSRMPPPPPPPPPPKGKGKGKKGKGKKGKGKVVRAPFLTQAARASARPPSPHARLSPSPPLLDCSQPPAPPPPPPAPTAKPCVLLSAADIAHAEKVERKEARIREEIECDEKLTTFFNTGAQKNAPRSAASSLFTTSPPLSPPPSCLPAVMETGMTPAEMIAYFEVNAPHMSADIIAHLQRLGLLPYPEAEAAAAVDVGAAAATVEEEEEAAAADDLPEAKRLKPIAEAVAAEVDEAEGGAEGVAAAAAPVAGDADGEVEAGADAEADAEGEAEAEGGAAAAAAAADEFDALQCGMCAEDGIVQATETEAPVKLSRKCAHCVFSGGESIEAMLAHSLAGEGDGDGDRSEPLGPPIPDEPDSLGLRLGEVVVVHSLITEAEHNGNTGLVRAQAPSNPRPTPHPPRRPCPPYPPSSHLTPAPSPSACCPRPQVLRWSEEGGRYLIVLFDCPFLLALKPANLSRSRCLSAAGGGGAAGSTTPAPDDDAHRKQALLGCLFPLVTEEPIAGGGTKLTSIGPDVLWASVFDDEEIEIADIMTQDWVRRPKPRRAHALTAGLLSPPALCPSLAARPLLLPHRPPSAPPPPPPPPRRRSTCTTRCCGATRCPPRSSAARRSSSRSTCSRGTTSSRTATSSGRLRSTTRTSGLSPSAGTRPSATSCCSWPGRRTSRASSRSSRRRACRLSTSERSLHACPPLPASPPPPPGCSPPRHLLPRALPRPGSTLASGKSAPSAWASGSTRPTSRRPPARAAARRRPALRPLPTTA